MGCFPGFAVPVQEGGTMTLREYILRWQEICDKNQSRPTTYAAHGYLFKNHILPGLGDIQLSELTVERVGEFLEERKSSPGKSRISGAGRTHHAAHAPLASAMSGPGSAGRPDHR